MIRFAWTRFRTQALVGAGVLAIAGAVLLVTGIQLNHAYYVAAAVCKQQGSCAQMFANTFPSQGYLTAANGLASLGLAVPALIGMFWGAPLAAREFETGTFRLAWTQGVTRTRWLAAKLAIAGAASIAVGELFSLMVHWWSNPIYKANPSYTPFTSGSFHAGIAPAGYAAFAFALGVTAGLLIRRTLPAMAVTLAVYTAVIIAFPVWVRPHLIPPVQTTSTVSLASIANMPAVGASNGHLFLLPGSAAVQPGAWVISSSQLTTPDGRLPASEPAGPCAGPASQPGPGPTPPSPAAAQACNDYIVSLHFRQTVIYEPASRYWAVQWVETAIYLGFAFALAGFSFWWINRNRSMELKTRRPRISQRAPALQNSP
jgi:ABC-type transport system involved in multi-copper enzyme maturation permease subunit